MMQKPNNDGQGRILQKKKKKIFFSVKGFENVNRQNGGKVSSC